MNEEWDLSIGPTNELFAPAVLALAEAAAAAAAVIAGAESCALKLDGACCVLLLL